MAERPEQRVDDGGIELRARLGTQLGSSLLDGQGLAVGTLRRHRVVGVSDGEDAAFERNLATDEPIGIAGAVNALVMRAHPQRDVAQALAEKHQLADGGVEHHPTPLVGVEWAGLVEYLSRDLALAHVVKQSGEVDLTGVRRAETQRQSDALGEVGHGAVVHRVPAGFFAAEPASDFVRCRHWLLP